MNILNGQLECCVYGNVSSSHVILYSVSVRRVRVGLKGWLIVITYTGVKCLRSSVSLVRFHTYTYVCSAQHEIHASICSCLFESFPRDSFNKKNCNKMGNNNNNDDDDDDGSMVMGWCCCHQKDKIEGPE